MPEKRDAPSALVSSENLEELSEADGELRTGVSG